LIVQQLFINSFAMRRTFHFLFLLMAGFLARPAFAQDAAMPVNSEQPADKVCALLDERVADLESVQDSLLGIQNEGARAAVIQAFLRVDDSHITQLGTLALQSELARAAGRKSAANPPEDSSFVQSERFRQRLEVIRDIDQEREQAGQLPAGMRSAFFAQWERASVEKFQAVQRQIAVDASAARADRQSSPVLETSLSPDMEQRLQRLAAIQAAQAQWQPQAVSPGIPAPTKISEPAP
jgi:hypothetical protein